MSTTTANPRGRGRARGPAGDDRRRRRGDHHHDARNDTVNSGPGVVAYRVGVGHDFHPGRHRLEHTAQQDGAFGQPGQGTAIPPRKIYENLKGETR